jgi:hypothetical protein
MSNPFDEPQVRRTAPEQEAMDRKAFEGFWGGVTLAAALLVTVIGFVATRDYEWLVYGFTGALAALLVLAGVSVKRWPQSRPKRDGA